MEREIEVEAISTMESCHWYLKGEHYKTEEQRKESMVSFLGKESEINYSIGKQRLCKCGNAFISAKSGIKILDSTHLHCQLNRLYTWYFSEETRGSCTCLLTVTFLTIGLQEHMKRNKIMMRPLSHLSNEYLLDAKDGNISPVPHSKW